jgi:predicted alpha/beta-hydrolase family hydrolase
MITPLQHLSFIASPEKGLVSALHQAAERPVARFVFAHGAGANIQHIHMQQLADALSRNNIDTLRYNFPYRQAGGGRTDSLLVCLATIDNALKLAMTLEPQLPTFLCGHSFGGRMSSHYLAAATAADGKAKSAAVKNQANRAFDIKGGVYFSFPLHPSKKPDVIRATHLGDINVPQLFVSGTRDTLASLDLLEPIVATLTNASLHKIDTADHGLKILKRTRQSDENVYSEAGRVVGGWVNDQLR